MYETTMTMVGRLATAVTQVTFNDGGVKATFRLASTERRFDRQLQQWVDGSRMFLTVVCWRGLAQRVLATLGIGDPVIVTGRLRAREYEKDGRTHSVIEIEAVSVGPDLARCSAAVVRRGAPPTTEVVRPGEPYGSPDAEPRPAHDAAQSPARTTPSEVASAGSAAANGTDAASPSWDAGPLVREHLHPDDQTYAAEPWPDEAAVGA